MSLAVQARRQVLLAKGIEVRPPLLPSQTDMHVEGYGKPRLLCGTHLLVRWSVGAVCSAVLFAV